MSPEGEALIFASLFSLYFFLFANIQFILKACLHKLKTNLHRRRRRRFFHHQKQKTFKMEKEQKLLLKKKKKRILSLSHLHLFKAKFK